MRKERERMRVQYIGDFCLVLAADWYPAWSISSSWWSDHPGVVFHGCLGTAVIADARQVRRDLAWRSTLQNWRLSLLGEAGCVEHPASPPLAEEEGETLMNPDEPPLPTPKRWGILETESGEIYLFFIETYSWMIFFPSEKHDCSDDSRLLSCRNFSTTE